VAFVTRTRTARVARRLAVVTVAVEQLEVVVPIRPTATSGEDVIDFHPIAHYKEQSALRALALLALQESRDAGRDFRLLP
jgi:hypothetical protein